MRMHGRTILITGGAGGIGTVLTASLMARGNRVIVCGRSESRLAAAERDNPGVDTVVCDVADRADVDRLGTWLEEHAPELDLVINNAAITHPLDLHDADAAELIESEVAVNIMGTVNVTHRLLPLLERRPEACLAVVTSGIAYAPATGVPGYSLTKAALHSFTRSLRRQLMDSTVSVVEIVPPAVDTEMIRDLTCRKMRPSDVAKAVIRGLEADRDEIRMGQTHLSYRLSRLSPAAGEALIRMAF